MHNTVAIPRVRGASCHVPGFFRIIQHTVTPQWHDLILLQNSIHERCWFGVWRSFALSAGRDEGPELISLVRSCPAIGVSWLCMPGPFGPQPYRRGRFVSTEYTCAYCNQLTR